MGYSWTRIYNPEQAAIDRCDPEGRFIKHWIPELKRVASVQLGVPPKSAGYLPPIVNYKQVRQQRVKQLERQRQSFRQTPDILPFLARMPESVIPFGSDRFESSEIQWAQGQVGPLFPPALDLESLDPIASQALRSWLVAHGQIHPASSKSKRTSRTPKTSRQRSSQEAQTQQLDFLNDLND